MLEKDLGPYLEEASVIITTTADHGTGPTGTAMSVLESWVALPPKSHASSACVYSNSFRDMMINGADMGSFRVYWQKLGLSTFTG